MIVRSPQTLSNTLATDWSGQPFAEAVQPRRSQEPAGTVRVTVPYGLSRALVVPLLPSLLERHPRISVELLVQNEMPDIVQHGIDVGILGGMLPIGSVVARKITSFEMLLCASPST